MVMVAKTDFRLSPNKGRFSPFLYVVNFAEVKWPKSFLELINTILLGIHVRNIATRDTNEAPEGIIRHARITKHKLLSPQNDNAIVGFGRTAISLERQKDSH